MLAHSLRDVTTSTAALLSSSVRDMIDLNNVPTVTNLQAANRQLGTAIRLFFNDEDAIAVHTLACAAREIYEKQCYKHGVDPMLYHIKRNNPHYTQKQIMDLLNRARNFF